MTTNLTQRPRTGSHGESREFYFDPDEFGRLFPERIVAWLEARPTFAVNLRPFHPDHPRAENEDDNVYLPAGSGGGLLESWYRFPDGAGLAQLSAFAQSVVRTMQNRVDEAQMRVPGYRDRVVHVAFTPEEGGMNLTMPPQVITALTARGRSAATKLVRRFAEPPESPSALSWDSHRWTRYRTGIAGAGRARVAVRARVLRTSRGARRALLRELAARARRRASARLPVGPPQPARARASLHGFDGRGVRGPRRCRAGDPRGGRAEAAPRGPDRPAQLSSKKPLRPGGLRGAHHAGGWASPKASRICSHRVSLVYTCPCGAAPRHGRDAAAPTGWLVLEDDDGEPRCACPECAPNAAEEDTRRRRGPWRRREGADDGRHSCPDRSPAHPRARRTGGTPSQRVDPRLGRDVRACNGFCRPASPRRTSSATRGRSISPAVKARAASAADGTERIDFHNGFGSMVQGHAPGDQPGGDQRLAHGTHFAVPTEDAIVVAEELARRWACRSGGTRTPARRRRWTRSGSRACVHGRDTIVKILARTTATTTP